jgi:hypothetical protein
MQRKATTIRQLLQLTAWRRGCIADWFADDEATAAYPIVNSVKNDWLLKVFGKLEIFFIAAALMGSQRVKNR